MFIYFLFTIYLLFTIACILHLIQAFHGGPSSEVPWEPFILLATFYLLARWDQEYSQLCLLRSSLRPPLYWMQGAGLASRKMISSQNKA